MISFGLVAFIQLSAPAWSQISAFRNLAIHLKHGLYANEWFDRITGAWKVGTPISEPDYVEMKKSERKTKVLEPIYERS